MEHSYRTRRWNKNTLHVILALVIVPALSFIQTRCILQAKPGKSAEHVQRTKLQTSSGTTLIAPSNFAPQTVQLLSFPETDYQLHLYSRSFSQGEAIYIEVLPLEQKTLPGGFKPSLMIDGRFIPLHQFSWGFRGFDGIPPLNNVGRKKIELDYVVDGHRYRREYSFVVKRTAYPESHVALNLGSYSNAATYSKPEVLEKIKYGTRVKRIAFASRLPDMITNVLSHPRDFHRITSAFYSKRVQDQYIMKKGRRVHLKPKIHYHRGLDFRGRDGDPVFAIAAGKVIVAEKLFYEGNFVLIDHGNQIFSAYMHMSSLRVKPGEMVGPGMLIGMAGGTGAVTAAHLHLSLYIRGHTLDPLSFIILPVRD